MGLLDNYKKSQVIIKKDRFITNFDYTGFSEEEKDSLIELEKKAVHTGNLLKDNLKELGDVFLEAQEIFANNKNGLFGKWYEELGFKKDFVYLCLERRNLSIQYNTKDIYRLPDRMIKDIKKISKDNEGIVIEILESDNPKEKIREIKEKLNPKKIELKNENLKERLHKISKLLGRIKINDEQIKKIEQLIEELEDQVS